MISKSKSEQALQSIASSGGDNCHAAAAADHLIMSGKEEKNLETDVTVQIKIKSQTTLLGSKIADQWPAHSEKLLLTRESQHRQAAPAAAQIHTIWRSHR